jgi:hypothetical protein
MIEKSVSKWNSVGYKYMYIFGFCCCLGPMKLFCIVDLPNESEDQTKHSSKLFLQQQIEWYSIAFISLACYCL